MKLFSLSSINSLKNLIRFGLSNFNKFFSSFRIYLLGNKDFTPFTVSVFIYVLPVCESKSEISNSSSGSLKQQEKNFRGNVFLIFVAFAFG